MTITGTKRRYPDCRIILSHAGVNILSERLAQLESHLFADTLGAESPKTAEEIMADAELFYFDLALVGTSNVLDMLLKWAPRERGLYGLNYSYAIAGSEYNTCKMGEYGMPAEDREAYCVGTLSSLFHV